MTFTDTPTLLFSFSLSSSHRALQPSCSLMRKTALSHTYHDDIRNNASFQRTYIHGFHYYWTKSGMRRMTSELFVFNRFLFRTRGHIRLAYFSLFLFFPHFPRGIKGGDWRLFFFVLLHRFYGYQIIQTFIAHRHRHGPPG